MIQGLVSLVRKVTDLEVVGVAENVQQAVELAERLVPDVVVMDVSMSGLSSPTVARRILSKLPDGSVLALSVHCKRQLAQRMLIAGASGCLSKTCAFDELAKAIRVVHSGRMYFGPGLGSPAGESGTSRSVPDTSAAEPVLSDREQEVIRLISEGQSSPEIASILGLSPHTVVRHRQNIMDKLGIHSVAGLTRFAVREGITTC